MWPANKNGWPEGGGKHPVGPLVGHAIKAAVQLIQRDRLGVDDCVGHLKLFIKIKADSFKKQNPENEKQSGKEFFLILKSVFCYKKTMCWNLYYYYVPVIYYYD